MATYPRHDEYWVPPSDEVEYPPRHGDVFTTPDTEACRAGNRSFHAVVILHPSCELNAKARPDSLITVARVRPVSDAKLDQQSALRTGWVERNGLIQRAFVHTFWLAPLPDEPESDLYVDFREVVTVKFSELTHRRAAMTHEARVHLIAREIYFRFRWAVEVADVRAAEAKRIDSDPNFLGPRPNWAIGT